MPQPTQNPARRNAMLERLHAEFPVFRDYRPLAIGIHKMLVKRLPDLDKGEVRKALHNHTGATRYLKALEEGGRASTWTATHPVS